MKSTHNVNDIAKSKAKEKNASISTDLVQHTLTFVLMQDLFCRNSSTESKFLAV